MGGHIMSTDEMTGIQALERIAPTKVMQPGQVERREFEYERHGTLSLIANFDVVSGQVVSPSVPPLDQRARKQTSPRISGARLTWIRRGCGCLWWTS